MKKSYFAKIYFTALLTLSIIVGVVSILYFQSQPKIYKSVGKFSVSYLSGEEFTTKDVYTTNYNYNLQAEARSLTEGIKSRVFVSSLLRGVGVKFNPKSLDRIDRIISAEVIKDSSIVEIEIYNNDVNTLKRINKVFLNILNSSDFVESQDPKIKVKAVDPLYSNNIPIYPETMKYSLLATVCFFLLGSILYFIFKS